ncbi:MAG TPA: hypothetical protein VNH11_15025 [Pirellulales bacterium]|nr:hypothetical protein [Pirellulales bacterium]
MEQTQLPVSDFTVFADSGMELLPPLPLGAAVAVVVAVPLAVLVLRKLLGPANAVSHRWNLWTLRGAILAVVAVVLLNPVRVDELRGPVERPELFYLLDMSASMHNGSPKNRWDESRELIEQARELAKPSPAIVKPFRFWPTTGRDRNGAAFSGRQQGGRARGPHHKRRRTAVVVDRGSLVTVSHRRRYAAAVGAAANFQPLRPRAAAGHRRVLRRPGT